jgi:nucleobase:cation symporter-1, NCS1 family
VRSLFTVWFAANTTFYTGPMVSHLAGADISWILGLIVAAGLYYLLMRPVLKEPRASAPPRGTVPERS